jgi:hypothetical protein
MSLFAAAIFVFGHLPNTVLANVGLFDEGIQLSLPGFIGHGLIPFRDFYVPYGPGNGFIGAVASLFIGTSILANRVLFVLLKAAVAGLATYLATRRRGLWAGFFMAILAMSFSTAATYVMFFACLIGGLITLIGWKEDADPLTKPASGNIARLTVAGALFGLGAWFRFEFGFILLVWSWLAANRNRSADEPRWPWVFWLPWLAAAAPYLVVVLSGGADELFYALRYAFLDYGKYRGVDIHLGDPWQLVGQITSNSPIGWGPLIIAVSYWAAIVGLPLLIVGPVLDRFRISVRPFARDRSRIVILMVAVCLFAMYSLSVRGDYGHASQLILPIWLTLLWSRFRWPGLGKGILISVVVVSLIAGNALTLDRWHAAAASWDEHGAAPFPRAARVPFAGSDAEQLADLLQMWTAIGSPDRVFVANRINDITHVNAVAVYWMLQAKPATWMTVFDPGFADQEQYQKIMARDLCTTQSPVVLMHTPRSPEHPPSLRFSSYLDRYLALNYTLFGRNERFDLRLPSGAPCAFPDDSYGFSDLEARRVELMEAGDIIPAAVIGEWQLEKSQDPGLRGDRILIAEQVGLWHPLTDVTGIYRELLQNWRAARSDSPPDKPLTVDLDPAAPGVTGVALYVDGLLAVRDAGAGFEVKTAPNELFLAALERDPSLGGVELLQHSLQRGDPGFLDAAELAYDDAPDNPGAAEQYGIALFDAKDYADAIEIFAIGLEHAPDTVAARLVNHIGSALRGTGDLACSAAAYTTAVDRGYEPAATRLAEVEAEGGTAANCADREVLDLLATRDSS